ncbi:MAG: Lrp/AsnC family transcriptional regulator [Anaerolineae bacterium]
MTHKIDHIDCAIVALLIEDGRLSCADIARRIGNISERTVRYRIDTLIEEGVLRISAVVNPKALGLAVTADVFLEVEPGQIMVVARQIAEFNCVTYVACSTGEADVSIQIVARDNSELYHFVTEVLANVPGVRRTTTVLLPIVLKDVYQWRIPEALCRA